MIAWWGWIAIWAGLALALLIMLGLLAWWLFRKFLVLVDDVADLAGSAAVLDAGEHEHVRPAIAVLAEVVAEVRRREDTRRAHRANRRRERHERRMTRARHITSAAASQREWPADWSRS
ncbi:hypothetical protein BH10ACT7_BH10ACT7_03170 [soil metagenome]